MQCYQYVQNLQMPSNLILLIIENSAVFDHDQPDTEGNTILLVEYTDCVNSRYFTIADWKFDK
jgi:hypothetical protein